MIMKVQELNIINREELDELPLFPEFKFKSIEDEIYVVTNVQIFKDNVEYLITVEHWYDYKMDILDYMANAEWLICELKSVSRLLAKEGDVDHASELFGDGWNFTEYKIN